MKTLVVLLFALTATARAQTHTETLVNFAHLESLMQSIRMNGQNVSIVHIYADYPSYRWTDAGDEGIACVDDGARAAVLYLRAYELCGDSSKMSTAESLLRFIMAMETDDGEFYNFLNADHSINRTGRTSIKSFGWWAGRAVWAMSFGSRVLMHADPSFAAELQEGVRKSLPNVGRLLKKYGRTENEKGFTTPQWLMYESGADATTELLLGLTEYYRATNDKVVADYIRKLADGLILMQNGDERTFPYGAHRSWRTTWHSWGNSQSCVLAYAGRMLSDTSMIASAEREARGFYSRLLIEGLLKEWDFAKPATKAAYEQIAYDIRPMALGLLRLFDATGNDLYLKMAGLSASWLFGNNVLHRTMYDSTTGRCYDGITDSTHLNQNSGAESTIEALYTLLEVERYPGAAKYLRYRKTAMHSSPEELEAEFRNDSGDVISLVLNLKTGSLVATDGHGK